MREHDLYVIERYLTGIASGVLLMNRYTENGKEAPVPWGFDKNTAPEGRGRFDSYALMPGINAAYGWFIAPEVDFSHSGLETVLEIFFCHKGRIGWKTKDGSEIYLEAGEMLIEPMDRSNETAVTLPLGYAEVFALSMDPADLDPALPEFLREIGFDARAFQERFVGNPTTVLAANYERSLFFSHLFNVPDALRFPYLKFKIQELLGHLYLQTTDPHIFSSIPDERITITRAVHDVLLAHLDEQLAIADLAKAHYIDPTTLQNDFKILYGAPIAAYMRRKRMEKAMELLRDPERSFTDVAKATGYRSRTAFSRVFKDATGITPMAYRQSHLNHD